MEELIALQNKLSAVIPMQVAFLREVIEENEDILVGLVTAQMDRGQTGTGDPIRPEYSPGYAAFKGFSTPNLRLEGDFHRSVFAEVLSGAVDIDATDEKTEKLVTKYGEEIFELQQSSIDEFNETVLLPEMMLKNERYFRL